MQTFRVAAPGFSIDVTADCIETLRHVEKYFLPCLPHAWRGARSAHDEPDIDPDAPDLNAPDIDMILRRATRADHFQVEVNGDVIAASEALPYLFALIQQTADEATIRHLGNRAAIHAGTVVYEGKAIAVSGKSGSGKSRLVQELLRQGAEYASDEYAILDPQGNVHPYPRALMIRRDGDDQYPVLPSELCAKVREQPAPAALFLFLHFQPDATGLDIRPLDRSEFLIRLLQSTPQVLADHPDVLDPLRSAVARAQSYEGVRGEVKRAAAEILQLASQAS